MKLTLSDFTEATAARILIGVVTGLNTVNNTASVLLNDITVPGVPIHYYCNHGVDTHAASRVFKVDDNVLVLYRGQGQPPSAANLTVLGLVDEIRRCIANTGIICDLNSGSVVTATGTAIMCSGLPVYSIKKSTPTLNALLDHGNAEITTLVAGHSDWIGLTETPLSWEWGSFRYGSGSPSSRLYISGLVWDSSAPGSIVGACMQGVYVIVATTAGHLHRRKLDKSDQWATISGPVFTGGPWLFNASGTQAVHCNGAGHVLLQLSGIESYTLTDYPYLVNTYESDPVERISYVTKEAQIFADFNGEELVIATLRFTFSSVYTAGSSDTEFICGTTEDSVPNYRINSGDGEVITTQRMWLDFNGNSIDMMSSDVITEESESMLHISGDPDDTTVNMTTSSQISDFVSFIANIDLRSGKYACYKMESQRTLTQSISGSYTCHNPDPPTVSSTETYSGSGSLKRSKIVNGQEIALKTCSLTNNGLSTTVYPSEDYNPLYDNLRFFTTTALGSYILTHSFLPFLLDVESPITKPVIAEGMHGISYAKNTKTGDELFGWVYDPISPPRVDYSGGNIATLLGIESGFSVENARIV